jgi:hypothetical protein
MATVSLRATVAAAVVTVGVATALRAHAAHS